MKCTSFVFRDVSTNLRSLKYACGPRAFLKKVMHLLLWDVRSPGTQQAFEKCYSSSSK